MLKKKLFEAIANTADRLKVNQFNNLSEPQFSGSQGIESQVLPLSFSKVFKRISRLAIPMGLSFTFSFEVFLAVLLLNHLSKTNSEVAAATLVSVLMNTISVFCMSPLFAVAIYLSGKLGEWREIINQHGNQLDTVLREKKEVIASTNANSLLIAAVVTPPAFAALFFSKLLLVSIFHQDKVVADAAQLFLRTYAFAIPGLMLRMSLEQIMFSFGKTRPAMWMGLIGLGIGGLISTLLGFGINLDSLNIHVPKLGSAGIALGFVVEAYLTALSYGLYVGLGRQCREFKFFKHMFIRVKNNWRQLGDILQIGGSISFTVALELAMTLAVGILSGLIGVKEQSAMSFNMQFVYFEFIALAAFSFSCAQELSREIGAKNYVDAVGVGKYGLLTMLICLTPLPLLFAINPKILALVSGGASEDISSILKYLVPIMSVGVIIDAIRYNLLQQLRALRDLFFPNLIAVMGMSSGILLAAYLGLKTSLGVNGVAVGYTVGVALAAIGLLLRWKNRIQALKIEQTTEAGNGHRVL